MGGQIQHWIDANIQESVDKITQTDSCQQGDTSGVYVEAHPVTFPAAGAGDVVDFLIKFARPVRQLAHYTLGGTTPNVVGISFQPAGISLSSANAQGPLIQFDSSYLYVFENDISQIYISCRGSGTGGTFQVLGTRGMRGVYNT